MSQAGEAAEGDLERALERVGDRWALLVVEALLPGPRRYSELQRQLPTIASNVLAERLRRLEAAQILHRERYSEHPPRLEYRLTEQGRSLAAVLESLRRWAGHVSGAGPAHRSCGTQVEPGWYCPTCARMVPEAELAGGDDVVFA